MLRSLQYPIYGTSCVHRAPEDPADARICSHSMSSPFPFPTNPATTRSIPTILHPSNAYTATRAGSAYGGGSVTSGRSGRPAIVTADVESQFVEMEGKLVELEGLVGEVMDGMLVCSHERDEHYHLVVEYAYQCNPMESMITIALLRLLF